MKDLQYRLNLKIIQQSNFLVYFPLLVLIFLFSSIYIYEVITSKQECVMHSMFNQRLLNQYISTIGFSEINILENFKNLRCVGDLSFDINKPNQIIIYKSTHLFNLILLINILYYLILLKANTLKDIQIFLLFLLSSTFVKFWLLPDYNFLTFLKFNLYGILLFKVLPYLEYKYINVNNRHIKEIDALRGLAVAIVIINHFNESLLPNGFIGVDIFFVISGFVITKSLLIKQNKNFIRFYLNFVKKRFKRLFPSLFYVVAISTILLKFVDLNFRKTLLTGVFSLLASSNIYLSIKLDEYFSDISKFNSFLHTWSLGVEEQFYLIYPLIFYLSLKINKKTFLRNFLIIITLFSLYFFINNYENNFSSAYYLMPFRFWEISLGCIAALVPKFKSKYLLNLSLISLIITIFFNFQNRIYLHLFSVLATVFLIYFLQTSKLKVLNSKILIMIGILSYNLYLWHYPVNTYFKWVEVNFALIEYIIIVFILAFTTHKIIEEPLRIRKKFNKNVYSLPIFLIIVIATFIPTLGKELESTSIKNQSFQPTYQKHECHLKRTINECFLDDKNVNSIYLIGDSHATNHFEALNNVFKPIGYDVKLYIDRNIIGYLVLNIEDCDKYNCDTTGFSQLLSFFEKNLTENDIIIFSTSRDRYVIDGFQPRNSDFKKLGNLKNSLEEIISIVSVKNSQLYLVDDIPKPCLGTNLNFRRDIIKNGFGELCEIKESDSLEERAALTDLLKSLSSNDNIIYIDPHSYLCFSGLCPTISDSYLIYGDFSPHTVTYSNKFLEKFWSEAKETLITGNS